MTTGDQIKDRMMRGFDLEASNSVYRQMRYAFGDEWYRASGDTMNGGTFPDYPDIIATMRKKGKALRIMNVARIELARIGYSDPEPEFSDVDKYTAEVRKQFYRKRYQAGEWQDQAAMAMMDGMQFGIGFIQHGMKELKNGNQIVTCNYVPRLQVIWDRSKKQPTEMRWICFCEYMTPEKALKEYGSEVANNTRTLYASGEAGNQGIQVVRIFRGYDLGYADDDDEPTQWLTAGDIGNVPFKIETSDYPDRLPVSFMTSVFLPGQRQPVGSVWATQPVNEALNEAEEAMQRDVKRGSAIMFVDTTQVDPKSMQDAMDGKGSGYVKVTSPNGKTPVVNREPAASIDEGRQMWLERLDENFNEASQTTELDRGNQLKQAKTLGEADLLTQRSSSPASWSTKQAILFHRRMVQTTLYCAKLYDTEPVYVDMSAVGIASAYQVNKPGDTKSGIKHWLEQDSLVIIGDDALTVTDSRQLQAQNMAMYMGMAPLIAAGVPIGPKWLAEKIVKTSGEKDPTEALEDGQAFQQQQQMTQQQQAGQPGQQPTQMPGGITPVSGPQQTNPFARPGQ